MEIVQAVKKLNSISRERLNFRRRPILCTTLYRNLMQASNFGGTFDQLFLWICSWNFHRRCLSTFLYHGAKKSNQGGPALNQSKALPLSSIFGSPAAHRVLSSCGKQSTLQRRRCASWRRAYPSPMSKQRHCQRSYTTRVCLQNEKSICTKSWENSSPKAGRTSSAHVLRRISLNRQTNRPRDREHIRLTTGRTLLIKILYIAHFPSEFRQQSDLVWL